MSQDAVNRDVESRRAAAADAFIAELLTRRDEHASRPVSDEEALAAALVRGGRASAPDAGFAAALEARLLAAGGASGPAHPPGGRLLPWRRWMALAALVALAVVLLAPPTRAGVEMVIRVGAVRIGLASPPHATPAAAPGATPTPTALPSALDLAGMTTLDQARGQAGFPIRLPAYPPDLGPPPHVYLQDLGGPIVALVWTDPAQPTRVRMALFEMTSGVFLQKTNARIVAETSVRGNAAIWTDGPYIVAVVQDGQVVYAARRLVMGHALIWTEGNITYRLETDLSLDEALRVAGSLR